MPYNPSEDSCGAGDTANELFDDLLEGEDISVPDIDLSSDDFAIPDETDNPLFQDVSTVTLADLTEETVDGTGAFDSLMRAVKSHLIVEFEQDRITGNEYSKAYVAAIQQAMGTAVQFVMGKDTAYWQSITAQAQGRQAEIDAVSAKIGLETAKVNYQMQAFQANSSRASYAQEKLKISLLDADYCLKLLAKETAVVDTNIKTYTLDNMMPEQLSLLTAQVTGQEATNDGLVVDSQIKSYTYENILPSQAATAVAQAEGAGHDNTIKQFQINSLLPAQHVLVLEQGEAQRGQTLNNRSDGAPVTGMLGKQRELYDQQIESYQRDAETKAAKMFIDSWVTQKTIDEGLLAPDALTNDAVNDVMNRIRIANDLGSNETDPQ